MAGESINITVKAGLRTFEGQPINLARSQLSTTFRFDHKSFTLDDWLPLWMTKHLPLAVTLPRTVFIKIYNDRQDRERERNSLKKMGGIQGRFISRLYGCVSVLGHGLDIRRTGGDALALQYFRGSNLHTRKTGGITEKDLLFYQESIIQCYDQISSYHIIHEDNSLTNLIDGEFESTDFSKLTVLYVVVFACALYLAISCGSFAIIPAFVILVTISLRPFQPHLFPQSTKRRVFLVDFGESRSCGSQSRVWRWLYPFCSSTFTNPCNCYDLNEADSSSLILNLQRSSKHKRNKP